MDTDPIQRIDPTVVCAIITAAGTILSTLLAWAVSRSTAKRELKKLHLIWDREDVVSSDDDFAQMANSIARYIQLNHSRDGADAAGKVNAIRARETGELAEALDLLYCAISDSRARDYPNFEEIKQCLSVVVEEKRKKKRQAQRRY